jgi:hypothetical protein
MTRPSHRPRPNLSALTEGLERAAQADRRAKPVEHSLSLSCGLDPHNAAIRCRARQLARRFVPAAGGV